ncbi:MAG: SusD/RagB family nutrient-binding outer membrane lipoprotein [Chitinophagaceae bacterium]|nr:MAG: SusD/RagB family nutrient-binding outer membrane lipoprotein [Chitinophagaceae bacterium]
MKTKLIYILGFVLFASSCTKDMTEKLNDNPKVPQVATGGGVFAYSELQFASQITTPNVNSGIFELIVQYWAETTYPQESQFQLTERNIPGNWWNTFYRNVAMNVKSAEQLINNEPVVGNDDKVVKKNKLAICEIFKAYSFSVLVNTFGNIPYSQALDPKNSTPKYDDQKDIFYALIDSLNDAVGKLDPNYGSFNDGSDLIYNGDVSSWIKFANSLKLRLGLLIADVDPAKAKTVVESAVQGGVISSNDENAAFKFLSAPPNTNPIWTNLVQSGRNDFVPTNTIVSMMEDMNDPRIPAYFTTVQGTSNYLGGVPGNGNSYKSFSHVADAIKAPNFPSILMGYDEVEFNLAEAVERGMNVGGTAIGHYDNAITASMENWGVSTNDIDIYLLNPNVNYLTASGSWKEKIGHQAYIALYLRGFDSWTEWRKLDFPALVKPAAAISEIPVRFIYPTLEAQLNGANYKAAGGAIGGDVVTTKLFWDKN